MIRSRITRLVLVAAVAAAIAAGSALGASLSASAYRSKADGICATAQKKLATIPEPSRPGQVAGWLDRSLDTIAPALEALRRLQPPASLRIKVSRYLTLQAQQQGALQDLLSRIRRGADPVKSYNADTPARDARTVKINAAAHAVGFRVCGVVKGG